MGAGAADPPGAAAVSPLGLARIAAILALMNVLFAALLVLGSFAVVQRADRRGQLVWFGTLSALLALTLGAGALGLVASLL